MKTGPFLSLLMISVSALYAINSVSAETRSTSADQEAVSLTIYNSGRALIRDRRSFDIQPSDDHIALMDVAEAIMPETVSIVGLEVLEQNYDFDLLSPQALIEKHVGQTVRLARRSTESGETLEWIEGKILSNNGGLIIQLKDGRLELLNGNDNWHLVFDEVPSNLRTTPTLSLVLPQAISGQQQVDITYLSGGMHWKSDYVMLFDESKSSASIDSWITLTNQSGISYHNASLQLLAGDVNIERTDMLMMAEAMPMTARKISQPQHEALQGYHLYSVPHKTTIKNKQSKQIRLFSAPSFKVEKKLRDQAYLNTRTDNPQKSKPEQLLRFNNEKPGLGLPFPRGIVRVYARDSRGNNQFIGEDSIDHTAINDEVELKLGQSFDISVQRKTAGFRQISKKQQRIQREIRINNGSEKAEQLMLSEIMPTQNWSIKRKSHPFDKESSTALAFNLELPPLTETIVNYEIELTYPN